jgi:hypothetical protein
MDLDELVFHPWSAQGPRHVPSFVGGSGSHPSTPTAGATWTSARNWSSRTSVTSIRASLRPPRNKPTASVRSHPPLRLMSVVKRRG